MFNHIELPKMVKERSFRSFIKSITEEGLNNILKVEELQVHSSVYQSKEESLTSLIRVDTQALVMQCFLKLRKTMFLVSILTCPCIEEMFYHL